MVYMSQYYNLFKQTFRSYLVVKILKTKEHPKHYIN